MTDAQNATVNEVDLPLDRVLTEGQVDSCVVLLSESERPPRGCAGVLDWHLKGAISDGLRQGIFSGKVGECAYFPWNFHGRVLHLLFLGIGKNASSQNRTSVSALHLASLDKNFKSLRREKWVISGSEFSATIAEKLSRLLPEGGQLWIAP